MVTVDTGESEDAFKAHYRGRIDRVSCVPCTGPGPGATMTNNASESPAFTVVLQRGRKATKSYLHVCKLGRYAEECARESQAEVGSCLNWVVMRWPPVRETRECR